VFHVALVVNPFASRVDERVLGDVVGVLQRVARVETLSTQRRGHATELARAATGIDAVVVLGGDGVVNEAVNGIHPDVPLAALPGGGTNVFVRALGLPRDAVRAASHVADALRTRRTRRIGLGSVNGRRFAFACGLGLDAAAVRTIEAHRSRRGRPGDAAFALALARAVPHFRRPLLDIRGVGRAASALIANADPYTYAGTIPLHVAPEARFELGLDLVAPECLTAASLPRFLRYMVRGDGQQRAEDVLYAHDVDSIEIRCDRPFPLQVDGEDLGDVEEVHVHAERNALSVLA